MFSKQTLLQMEILQLQLRMCPAANAVETYLDAHFDNARMERIYPNAKKVEKAGRNLQVSPCALPLKQV